MRKSLEICKNIYKSYRTQQLHTRKKSSKDDTIRQRSLQKLYRHPTKARKRRPNNTLETRLASYFNSPTFLARLAWPACLGNGLEADYVSFAHIA
mmetsp:Transcript_113058/g.178626  ORF Transcript_113058/g.178626 Transcript_113058/m.178626 type:complete len:95 (-) Transcript_113058:1325-1609(-)